MTTAEILSRLEHVKKTADGWMAECPGHSDKTPSLCIKTGGGGRTLFHCQAGCQTETVCAALGIRLADLFAEKSKRIGAGKEIVATYPYHDANGKLLFEVVRFAPKDFRQRRPDSAAPDGWTWNTKGVQRVLFRLPEIIRAIKARLPIYLTEGEKDALAMAKHGFAATCNAGGAGKWQDSCTETLKSAEVIIIADKDAPGRKHAADVARKLVGVARIVRIIECPDLDGGPIKDAADYFAAGGEAVDLDELAQAAPLFAVAQEIQTAFQPGANDLASVTAWIRGEILSAAQDKQTLPTVKNSAIARQVVESLGRIGHFYFHADLRDFDSALFFNAHTKRLEQIRADAFSAWLAYWLCVNRAAGLFKFILSAVETAALSGPLTMGIVPESFWAARPGALYLSNGDGSAAKITANCVPMVDNGSDGVLFAAGKTLAPWKLTEPRDVFESCTLFRNAHCGASHGKLLLQLWIYSFATMPRSKPPLGLIGEIGAGKTRTAKAIAELYGIPFRAAKVEEGLESNFWPNVNEGGLFILDNADSKCRWLADAIAAAATDGSSQRRKLYTNSETVLLRANAWLAVTSANPTFGNDAGLADRMLLCRMERRAGETGDGLLTVEILANRDAGLSHIALTLQKALADSAPTPAKLNERHPDWAAFAVKIGLALGRGAEAIQGLQTAEADKSAFCLENDAIGAALLAYLNGAQSFNGTATELASRLIDTDKELDGKLSAKRLGKRLAMLWPHLNKTLPVCRKEQDRTRLWHFTFRLSAELAEFKTDFSQNP